MYSLVSSVCFSISRSSRTTVYRLTILSTLPCQQSTVDTLGSSEISSYVSPALRSSSVQRRSFLSSWLNTNIRQTALKLVRNLDIRLGPPQLHAQPITRSESSHCNKVRANVVKLSKGSRFVRFVEAARYLEMKIRVVNGRHCRTGSRMLAVRVEGPIAVSSLSSRGSRGSRTP